jgi:hypothetical protein
MALEAHGEVIKFLDFVIHFVCCGPAIGYRMIFSVESWRQLDELTFQCPHTKLMNVFPMKIETFINETANRWSLLTQSF